MVCAGSAVWVLVALLYFPDDSRLASALVEATTNAGEARKRLKVLAGTSQRVKQQLELLSRERCSLLTSISYQRALLLQQNWKAMRDSEWEEFLVKVFSALGGKAQRIGRAGDQGVDLIAEYGGQRYAVQAKGYFHAVNNKAVQEVVAGKAHYGCAMATVITNSRFARSAVELAQSNDCILIGESEIPDFVMGTVDFLRRPFPG
jgi:HJR/Mrr/RecB family endonuclease